jgi:hypothetical protein
MTQCEDGARIRDKWRVLFAKWLIANLRAYWMAGIGSWRPKVRSIEYSDTDHGLAEQREFYSSESARGGSRGPPSGLECGRGWIPADE